MPQPDWGNIPPEEVEKMIKQQYWWDHQFDNKDEKEENNPRNNMSGHTAHCKQDLQVVEQYMHEHIHEYIEEERETN
jgi:hypothetical protein